MNITLYNVSDADSEQVLHWKIAQGPKSIPSLFLLRQIIYYGIRHMVFSVKVD